MPNRPATGPNDKEKGSRIHGRSRVQRKAEPERRWTHQQPDISGALRSTAATQADSIAATRNLLDLLVRKRGFEPPLPCGNKLLRLARLPVPPLPHKEGTERLAELSSITQSATRRIMPLSETPPPHGRSDSAHRRPRRARAARPVPRAA